MQSKPFFSSYFVFPLAKFKVVLYIMPFYVSSNALIAFDWLMWQASFQLRNSQAGGLEYNARRCERI